MIATINLYSLSVSAGVQRSLWRVAALGMSVTSLQVSTSVFCRADDLDLVQIPRGFYPFLSLMQRGGGKEVH